MGRSASAASDRDAVADLLPIEEVTLRDGSRVRIARIMPRDASLIAEGFKRLSTESRRLRFLTSKPSLSSSELRYLTEVDGHRHEALGAVDPATGRGVAVARFVRDEQDPSHAEVAVTVADDWQRRGLGTVMLERLSDRARAEGVSHFTALVAGDNPATPPFLEGTGGSIKVTQVGSGALEYEIELAPKGLGRQLETLLRAAAEGTWQVPPRLCDALRALVPIHFHLR